jgi:hypothetical protein
MRQRRELFRHRGLAWVGLAAGGGSGLQRRRMSNQMLSTRGNQTFFSKNLTEVASSEPPDVRKWPKRWRFAFILGTALLFWAGAVFAIGWI